MSAFRRLLTLGLVLVGLLLAASAARAYPLYWIGTQVRGTQQSWQFSGAGSDGQPWSGPRAPAAAVHDAIAATFVAFDQGHPKDAAGNACSTLAFTDVTPDTGAATERLDEEGKWTEGIFVSKRTDPIYQYMQGGVVAFALPAPDDDGYVQDCDTVYNAVDVPFSTNGSGLSLQGVGMQETAHCFGLHHVCMQSPGDGQPPCDGADVDTHSVMFPFADPGFGADQPDGRDQDNMCQLYPANGIGRPCDPSGTGPTGTPVGFAVPDCADGTTCACTVVGQICTKTCAGDTDCPSDARCASGSCVPNFYPGTENTGVATRTGFTCDTGNVLHKPIGEACASDADCGQGETCLTGLNGGYCSFDCANANCPPDGECVTDVLKAGDAWCLKPCTFAANTCAPTGCRDGQVCQNLGTGTDGVCFTGCASDADCDSATPPQAVCDTSSGMCHPKHANPVCGPHHDDPVSPVCVPVCLGLPCGTSDTCGGKCGEGSGCVPPKAVTPPPSTPPAKSGCGCSGLDVSALALLGLAFRRRRSAALLVMVAAAGLALTACSPPPVPVDGTDGGAASGSQAITPQNFVDQRRLANCDYAARCVPSLLHYYCDSTANAAVTAELAAGRMGFDPALATKCVGDSRNDPCPADPFSGAPRESAAICESATPPRVADGAACFDDRDCTGGWCNTSATCPGVCAKAAAVGAACGGVKCAEGSYCSPRSGKCVGLVADGGSCFFGPQCQSRFCRIDPSGQSAHCAEAQPATGAAEGEGCTQFGDCRPGLYCRFDPATLDGQQQPSGTCQKQVDPGYPCGADGDGYGIENACAQGLACVGFSAPAEPSLHDPLLPGACLPWAGLGGSCTPVRAGAAAAVTGCEYGLVCGKDGKCALPTPGNACGIDQYSGCVSGETCDGQQGKCVAYGAPGDMCRFDTDCVSRSCVGGKCARTCAAQ